MAGIVIDDWARSKKADLIRLQQETGTPALWAAAQMCYESAVDGGEGLSEFAARTNNYARLKWAEWQRDYGCQPVQYDTHDVVNGQTVTRKETYCACPTWQVWLRVYGQELCRAGRSADPQYNAGVAEWMARLAAAYTETPRG
ncbi:MAG: hypothetical protein ACM3XM_15635 [Mycobacterium leprae]